GGSGNGSAARAEECEPRALARENPAIGARSCCAWNGTADRTPDSRELAPRIRKAGSDFRTVRSFLKPKSADWEGPIASGSSRVPSPLQIRRQRTKFIPLKLPLVTKGASAAPNSRKSPDQSSEISPDALAFDPRSSCIYPAGLGRDSYYSRISDYLGTGQGHRSGVLQAQAEAPIWVQPADLRPMHRSSCAAKSNTHIAPIQRGH